MLKRFIFPLGLALCQAVTFGVGGLAGPIAQADEAVLAVASSTVNINTADAVTLADALAGVGQSRAEAIVRYREEFGPFFTPEDLLQVKGIGPAVLERNRARIALE
ncbi:MAG: helix-hairpin-helix domain-containing protein [Halieaceae bacterium]|jgi:competence protein ComEA|nr:helix-hairpin-helix domain-containing protein [Halieaceae bacterium]